ncbi:MAG: tetratricopeptide repeat protein [Phycisphaeraceae bacterium]|nr:tetratricopeptide repeat protein [Phycisphaeraceae bacterium]
MTPDTTPRNTWLLAVLLLVVLPIVAYLPAMRGGFIWDDDAHVTANKTLDQPDALHQIWLVPGAVPQYYPLAHTAFWIQWKLFGKHPMGYHIVNVAMHVLSCLLLWRILRRLMIPGALLAAAIFALHPVHVESVAWITELKNTQSLLFYLLAAWAYLRFDPTIAGDDQARHRWLWYVPALLLFLAALWSKTVTASLPAALVLVILWKRGGLRWRDVWPVLPMFLVGGLAGLITIRMEKQFVGAVGSQFDFTLIDRVLIAGRAAWFYAMKLLWPAKLTFSYPRWTIDAGQAWQYAFPAAWLVVLAALWFSRRKIGSGPLVAVLFFLGTLVPALGFFDVWPFVYSFVADHFQYHASFGLIVLAAAGLSRLGWRQWMLAVPLLLLLAALTWKQGLIYRDLETLWRDTIAKNPSSWMAYNNLAGELIVKKRYAEAQAMAERSIAINKLNDRAYNNAGHAAMAQEHYPQARDFVWQSIQINPANPSVYVDMGEILALTGEHAESIKWYRDAVRVEPGHVPGLVGLGRELAKLDEPEESLATLREAATLKPDHPGARYYLALQLAAMGQYAEAATHYELALKLKPDLAEAHNNYGTTLVQLGKVDDAIRQFRQALVLEPQLAEARRNLAAALAIGGQPADAEASLRKLLAEHPQDADAALALGKLLAENGKDAEAEVFLQQALRAQPDDAMTRYALAGVLQKLGRFDEAAAQYERSLALSPDRAETHNDLGAALESLGRSDEAMAHYQQAVKLNPSYPDARYNLGLLLQHRRRWHEAETQFHEILKLKPNHGASWFQLAATLESQGRDAEARPIYQAILRASPRQPLVLARLARLSAKQGDATSLGEALRQAEQACVMSQQQDATVLDLYAQVCALAEQWDKAALAADQAMRLARANGNDALAREIEPRLAQYRQRDGKP